MPAVTPEERFRRDQIALQELGARFARLNEAMGAAARNIELGYQRSLREARLARMDARAPDRERRSELRLEQAIRVERAKGLAYVQTVANAARRDLGLP